MRLMSDRSFRILGLATATALTFMAAGCGIGAADVHSGPSDAVAFSGAVIGGENPISGATVSFYETAATGVATTTGVNSGVYVPVTALTPLGTTVSDSGGNFKFTTALACSNSSDYVYATAAGGDSGANAVNNNILLMAAVGSCSGFGASTSITINELSTVAAAYALQGFTTVSGAYSKGTAASVTSFAITGNEATITMAASETYAVGTKVTLSGFLVGTYFNGNTYTIDTTPSGTTFTFPFTHANVATTPDATGVVTPVTTFPSVSVTSSSTNYVTASETAGSLSAAGLAHAFANAANLVNINTGFGTANTVAPTNAGTTVPAALINALGNSIQACVNSTGGVATSSTANDGTSCGKLFSYTTIGSAVPTNTLQALLNLARVPTSNVSNIFSLGSGVGAFAPAITSAPTDWSIAIAYLKYDTASTSTYYPGAAAVCTASPYTTGLCYPYNLALDYNDNVYVTNSSASTTTYSNILKFNSNGTPVWQTAVDLVNTSPRGIAADALGNIFLVNNSGSTTSGTPAAIVEYSASTGAVEQTIATNFIYPYGVAVDTSNNLWITSSAGGAGVTNLYEYTCSSPCGTASTYTQATFGTTANGAAAASVYAYQPAIDQGKNIWANGYHSGAAAAPFVLPYTAAQAGPPAVAAYDASEVSPTPAPTGVTNYGIAVDSSGNGWITTTTTIVPLVASGAGTSFALATGTAVSVTGASSLRFDNMDGNNTVWTVDNSTGTAVAYSTIKSGATPYTLKPCIAITSAACPTPANSTASAASVPGLQGPRTVQVDSTGSVWVVGSTNGNVLQIIGAGAPTWPLLSDVKPGLMP